MSMCVCARLHCALHVRNSHVAWIEKRVAWDAGTCLQRSPGKKAWPRQCSICQQEQSCTHRCLSLCKHTVIWCTVIWHTVMWRTVIRRTVIWRIIIWRTRYQPQPRPTVIWHTVIWRTHNQPQPRRTVIRRTRNLPQPRHTAPVLLCTPPILVCACTTDACLRMHHRFLVRAYTPLILVRACTPLTHVRACTHH